MTWNGERITAELRERLLRSLQQATLYAHTQILMALNVPNTGVTPRGGLRIYPNPSQPGQPPRKRTGWLQRNVAFEVDQAKLASRIGMRMNAMYGVYLELGTRRMAARPWLFSTVRRFHPQLKAFFTQGGR